MTLALLERIAGIMAPVLFLIGVGWLWARRHAPDLSAINRINMDVFAPALIFTALASRDFDVFENRWLLIASAAIVLGSGVLAWPIARLARQDPRTFVPPMMFMNSGNMGLPVAILAFGQAGLGPAVAMFTVSNALNLTLGVKMVEPKATVGRLLLTPMNVATAAGFAVAVTDLPRPEIVLRSLELLGQPMIPLLLFALGVRLTSVSLGSVRVGLLGAIVCPLTGLAAALAIDALLPLTGTQRALMYIFASLPPAVMNFMVAERYARDPGRVAAIVLVGNLASVVFVPIGLVIGLRP